MNQNVPGWTQGFRGAALFRGVKECVSANLKNPLERRYGSGHLHFITCSCYRRLSLLDSPRARDRFLKILSEVRDQFDFALEGFVVMPEHIHLLFSEPNHGNPSGIMKTLKQRVSRNLRSQGIADLRESDSAEDGALRSYPRFWERRFYDFNVWSTKKRNEKLNYIHLNPVKRGLVARPSEWMWSSYRFYSDREEGLCTPNLDWKRRTE